MFNTRSTCTAYAQLMTDATLSAYLARSTT